MGQRERRESPIRSVKWERQLWVGLGELSVLRGQMRVFS